MRHACHHRSRNDSLNWNRTGRVPCGVHIRRWTTHSASGPDRRAGTPCDGDATVILTQPPRDDARSRGHCKHRPRARRVQRLTAAFERRHAQIAARTVPDAPRMLSSAESWLLTPDRRTGGDDRSPPGTGRPPPGSIPSTRAQPASVDTEACRAIQLVSFVRSLGHTPTLSTQFAAASCRELRPESRPGDRRCPTYEVA